MAARPELPEPSLTRRDGYWLGEFRAMASPCQVLSRANRSTVREQLRAAADEAWRIEAKYSRYRAGNIIDRINTANGMPVEVDEETAGLLDFASDLHRLSGRRFDISSGVLREVWTFDGSDRVPAAEDVERVLQRVGWDKIAWERPLLTLAPGMQIDLGGIGKEYAVDRAARLAGALAPAPCLMNFGGDVAAVAGTSGIDPWRVGIESIDPDSAKPCKRIALAHGGLATSGDARRFLLKDGVRYGHLLDPRTGWPVAGAPRSVTVAADTCTQAGMLSTFAMLMGAGAEAFLERQRVRYWCIR
ncbi:MAG TPA: FAD:protein FMN transferase [Woeseiaceae bacterium]|nr:FAD:protein FMN transferase [Woeseiaceae bacterium]